ncbi:hypothetical protein OE88DRAFT_1666953 [Heliocybe sulcata]|uniref:Uncharacterized protein n=1 Tax=Heliocybe sulcata TaxID=5364 RepID=A0A5C3MPR7_9AGAM|nr:hypothetical protein OE88DRAFT_1666953 [Heliocybe sulcata]
MQIVWQPLTIPNESIRMLSSFQGPWLQRGDFESTTRLPLVFVLRDYRLSLLPLPAAAHGPTASVRTSALQVACLGISEIFSRSQRSSSRSTFSMETVAAGLIPSLSCRYHLSLYLALLTRDRAWNSFVTRHSRTVFAMPRARYGQYHGEVMLHPLPPITLEASVRIRTAQFARLAPYLGEPASGASPFNLAFAVFSAARG